MKARPFLAVVLAMVLLLAGLAAGGWWLVWERSPLQLARQPLSVPRAARFVPRPAPLSFYFFSDGERPVAYARAVAPTRQRRPATDAVERLRDGAFAAAGLDYRNELASWLAPEIALALFDDGSAGSGVEGGVRPGGWLLALRSRDDDGARRFLQRFWQTRSLAGTDLQVSSYRGMGLISGRGALVGQRPVPLATALVDDDLVLLASGRGVLEQALDVSQIDELNQAAQPELAEDLARLGPGVAVLLARPAALEPWLGLSLPHSPSSASAPGSQAPLLRAVLRPDGLGLQVQGVLEHSAPTSAPTSVPVSRPAADPDDQRHLLDGLRGNPFSLALLQDPAALLRLPLLRPLLTRAAALEAEQGPIPPLVAAADTGPLLVSRQEQGWLLGTPADRPDPAALEAALAAEGLIPAPLDLDDRSVLVWTRLEAASGRRRGEADDQLQASLAGWRSTVEGLAWWGRSLALLEERKAGPEARRRRHQIESLDRPAAALQWAMGPVPAAELLRQWQPWRLLSAVAGGGLVEAVQGLSLSLEPGDAELGFRGRLDLG